MNVSIIIINYNTTNYVKNCIESILTHTSEKEYEIIVVDNNSSDNNLYLLENIFKDVKFYYKNENDGFGAGCNYGAARSSGNYLFFMNPDVCLVNDIVKELLDFMEMSNKTGVCSALIMGMDKEYQYCFNDFPSIGWELLELSGYYSNKKVKKNIYKVKDRGEKGLSTEIDWAIGACLFIRREVFEEVKGFNEDYFLYYEDTDLQKKIKNIGYRVVMLGHQKVLHLGKSSIENSENGSVIYFSNMHKSKLIYYSLHKGFLYTLIVRSVNVAALIIRMLFLPFRNMLWINKKRKLSELNNILKIYLSFRNI